MKRRLSFLLALLLLPALCACSFRETPAKPAQETEAPAATSFPRTETAVFDNTGVEMHGTPLGTTDCRAEYRSVYSDIWELPEGESLTRRFYNYTDGAGIWNNFLVILQSTPEGHSADENADYREYAVLRADHFGWGEGYDEAVAESDWDWERFTGDLNGALIALTVTHRAGKADVSVRAETEGERSYHQSYTGIAVDGPLYACLRVEKACLDLLD